MRRRAGSGCRARSPGAARPRQDVPPGTRAHTLEGWAPGIRLREEWFFSQAPEIDRLDAAYRLAFRLAGRFAVANKAHRVVYYDL